MRMRGAAKSKIKLPAPSKKPGEASPRALPRNRMRLAAATSANIRRIKGREKNPLKTLASGRAAAGAARPLLVFFKLGFKKLLDRVRGLSLVRPVGAEDNLRVVACRHHYNAHN